MKISLTAVARTVGITALVGMSVTGCHSTAKPAAEQSGSSTTASSTASGSASSSAPSSAVDQAADYSALLIKGTDINAPEVFTAGPPVQNPDGKPGVATTFSNPDGSHKIVDTILILPDAAAAAGALESAKTALATSVVEGNGAAAPAETGAAGTTVAGNSPDGSKSVTVLLFTEGKAFTTLEFDGPVNVSVPLDFVNDVAQKQHAAIKSGLPG